MRCPGGFHRFQGIRARRFTLSTAGLYDLYTRYGQTVDKKALLPDLRNYPQVPPQPEGPLYRGFQVHKYLKNQLDNAFLHEIWAYHHHHALDLYPDLEARLAPTRPQRDLWTVASADEATAALRPTICFTPPASSGNVHQSETQNGILDRKRLDSAQAHNLDSNRSAPIASEGQPASIGNQQSQGRYSPIPGDPAIAMLHVEPAKKTPGKVPGVVRFHVEQAAVRDAAASPHGATSRCWTHAPVPRSWSRAAG